MDGDLQQLAEMPNAVPLDALLTNILLWKPHQITSFLKDAYNSIKPKETKRVGTGDEEETKGTEEINKLKRDLESEAKSFFPEHGDWKLVLNEYQTDKLNNISHFNALTSRSRKGLDTTSVVDLLSVMRNKYEHYDEFTMEEREELGWSSDLSSKVPDNSLYVQYWTRRYPKLLPYLWLKFCRFKQKSTLTEYYNSSINIDLIFDITDLLGQIFKSLFVQVESGGLVARYSANRDNGRNLSIEFRSMPVGLQQRILTGSSSWSAEIGVAGERIVLTWVNTNGAIRTEYSINNYENKRPFGNENVTFIVTNGTKEAEDTIFEKCSKQSANLGESCEKVIYFNIKTEQEIALTANKIANCYNTVLKYYPVQWIELTQATRDAVNEKGEMRLQNSVIKFSDILPKDDGDSRNRILSSLKGNVLNSILKGEKPEILSKHTIPLPPDVYVERSLYSREILSKSVFRNSSRNDIFVVLNIQLELLRSVIRTSHSGERIIVIDNLDDMLNRKNDIDNSEIIVIRNDTETILDEFNAKCQIQNYLYPDLQTSTGTNNDSIAERLRKQNLESGVTGERRAHLLRYKGEQIFQWLATHGNYSIVKDSFAISAREVGSFSEGATLNEMELCKSEKKLIVFADTAAMGKSHLLRSLARKLATFNDRIVVFFNMTEFVNNLIGKLTDLKKISSSDIVYALKELTCSSGFENTFLEYALTKGSAVEGLSVEILLDALDEVPKDRTQLALQSIEIILRDFTSTRVWVAMREHMLEDIRVKFGVLGYKMDPFTETEQETVMVKHWIKYWKKFNTTGECPDLNSFSIFAKQCINIPISGETTVITGTPLICQMMAEIYEQQILKNDFTLETNVTHSLIDIYEKMFERKLEVYLKVKNSLPDIKMNSRLVSTFREEMEQAHIYFALKLLFSEEVANGLLGPILMTTSRIDQFHVDILEQGIIDNLLPLAFIHKTFAEYFAALFFYNVYSGKYYNLKDTDEAFQKCLWDEIIAYSATLYSNGYFHCKLKNEILYQFFNAMWEQDRVKRPAFVKHKHAMINGMLQCFQWESNQQNVSKLIPVITIYISRREYEDGTYKPVKEDMLSIFISALKSDFFNIGQDFTEKGVTAGYSEFEWYMSYGIGILHNLVGTLSLYRSHWPPLSQITELIDYIVGKDASLVEQKYYSGRTPLLALMGSVRSFDPKCQFMELLTYFVTVLKADVNALDRYNNSVLHAPFFDAQKHKYYGLFQMNMLLAWHAQWTSQFITNGFRGINIPNRYGDTPLMAFVSFFLGVPGTFAAVNAFERHGADFNVQNKEGQTVIQAALKNEYLFLGSQDSREENRLELVQELINCGPQSVGLTCGLRINMGNALFT